MKGRFILTFFLFFAIATATTAYTVHYNPSIGNATLINHGVRNGHTPFSGTSFQSMAQSVQLNSSGEYNASLNYILVSGQKMTAVAGSTCKISIYASNSTIPINTVYGASVAVDQAAIGTTQQTIRFNFSGVQFPANATVWLIPSCDDGASDVNLRLYGSNTDVISGVCRFRNEGDPSGTFNYLCNDYLSGVDDFYFEVNYEYAGSSPPPAGVNYHYVRVLDYYLSTPIQGATVTMGGLTNTTDVAGYAEFYNLSATQVFNVTQTKYASALNQNASVNTTTTVKLTQGRYYVSILDSFDNSTPISGAVVTLTDGSTNTTNSTGQVLIYSTNASSYGYNATKSGWFSESGLAHVNQSVTGYMSQAYTSFTLSELITGASIACPEPYTKFNITVLNGGRTYNCHQIVYLRPGIMNFSLSIDGYYPLTTQQTYFAGNTSDTAATGAYNTILNVTASNFFTGVTINNFNASVEQTTNAYTASGNTMNGFFSFNAIQGLLYNTTVDAAGYAYSTKNTTPAALIVLVNHTLTSSNSVQVYVRDESTNALITASVNITTVGTNFSQSNLTTTGGLFLSNLSDGNYSITLASTGYTTRTYTVTVADRSTQTLNAYLTSSSNTVIFTILDDTGGDLIENSQVTMYRQVVGVWTPVEAKLSDITGRVQFSYDTSSNYKFYVATPGYQDKIFYLTPILYGSYNVQISKLSTIETEPDYLGVSVIYAPKTFYAGVAQNFSWIIQSPAGLLTNYSLTVAYPAGNHTYNGTNAIGQQFTMTVSPSNSSFYQTLNLTYTYATTITDEQKTFTYQYVIVPKPSTTTIASNKDNTYGLSWFERVLICTIIVVLFAGIVAYVAGPTFGLAMGMMLMGLFTYLGMMPLLATAISILVGFIIMVSRSSE